MSKNNFRRKFLLILTFTKLALKNVTFLKNYFLTIGSIQIIMEIGSLGNSSNTEPPNNKIHNTNVNSEAKVEKVIKDNNGIIVSISPEALDKLNKEKKISLNITIEQKPSALLNFIQKVIKMFNV